MNKNTISSLSGSSGYFCLQISQAIGFTAAYTNCMLFVLHLMYNDTYTVYSIIVLIYKTMFSEAYVLN